MALQKNSLLDHFKALMSATDAAGIEAIMGLKEFAVHLRKDGQTATLIPQFMSHSDGVTMYKPVLSEDATMFAGWLPYRNKRWPIAGSKLEFKKYVAAAGLHTPAFTRDAATIMADCVIKSDNSSFGANLDGPFRRATLGNGKTPATDFLEAFVEGRIAKVWFWNGTPVCMESDRMPDLIGDGRSTIQELLLPRFRSVARLTPARGQALMAKIDVVLAYYQMNRNTVLAARQRQVVEFRYGSDLIMPGDREIVDLCDARNASRAAPWKQIGAVLDGAIPSAIRQGTLFSVDAIVDAADKIWLLEMNSNPTVHPLCYGLLVESVFPDPRLGDSQRVATAAHFH